MKRTRFFGVRFTPAELDALRSVAEQRSCSIGAVIRSAALNGVQVEDRDVAGERSNETAGAPVALQA